MPAPRFLPAKAVFVGLFGLGVFGLGVGVASVRSSTPSLSVVGTAAAPSPTAAPGDRVPGFARGKLGGGISPFELLGPLATDAGVTPMQILTDIKNGQTLDQIAGANDAKVKADALAAVQKGLDTLVTKGAITKDSETHLLADAKDAIDQLMAAKLGTVLPALGSGGLHGANGKGFPFPGGPHALMPTPSASPAV